MQRLLLIIVALSIVMVFGQSLLSTGAQAVPIIAHDERTKTPCPNAPLVEEAGVLEAREGRKLEDEIRSNPNDKERWASLIIFSSSTDKAQLAIPIVMAINFSVSLDPKKGALTFATPKTSQSFLIGSTAAGEDNLCSDYQIRVVEGGPTHALIKLTCPKQEYRPGRFYRGTDYYLYDMKSNTARQIWSASTILDTSSPFPSAKPELALKTLPDGYQLDWSGTVFSDNGPMKMTIHNAYRRAKDEKGATVLVCYDMTKPSHPVKENEMCESNVLAPISH